MLNLNERLNSTFIFTWFLKKSSKISYYIVFGYRIYSVEFKRSFKINTIQGV